MRAEPDIRPARLSDVAALHELLRVTWHDTYDALLGRERVAEISARWHSPERLRAEVEDPRRTLLAAELEGHLIATASGHLDADTYTIARLYVHPEHQRSGVGALLLQAMLAEAGDARIWLEVEPRNQQAIAFYTKHGFCVVDRGRDCGEPGSGIEHLVMERRPGS